MAGVATLGALLVARTAGAWTEAHQTTGDVTVEVGPDGVASVHDLVRWQVTHGPLHWIDLENINPATALDAAVTVTSDDGRTLGAHLAPRDARADTHVLRVTVDDPHAFERGAFTFDVRWRVDWVKTHVLSRDPEGWRVAWASPLASDGLDPARTTFVFPPARRPPIAVVPETGAPDDTALATLSREPTRDVLELVRPHVGRGEAVRWDVRIDPSALPAVTDPRLRPPAPAAPPPEPDRVREVCAATALGALALLFALLVAHKQRAFAAACAAKGTRSRSLVPVPSRLRPAGAGIALALGVALQATDAVTAGSLLVACATLLAASRPPAARWPVRGPGRWLILRPDEAFADRGLDGDWLDASTRSGRLAAFAALAAVTALVLLARRFGAMAPWLVGLDALALVPLFLTGCASDLPPEGARASAPWLAPVFERLHAIAALRVAPWARVAAGPGGRVDELRLLVLPRASIPGVVGVEVGRAWSTSPVGWAGTPEVLVRVLEGSSAAARLARELPRARMFTGRRADERVVRLRPRSGSQASTVALTRGLAEALTNRRVPARSAPVPRPERRIPRPVTPPGPIAAPKAC